MDSTSIKYVNLVKFIVDLSMKLSELPFIKKVKIFFLKLNLNVFTLRRVPK